MRKLVRIFLLFIWFSAIIAPSVITLMDWDNNILVNTLSEEEQKEQEKKDPTEEKIVQNNPADFSLIASSTNSSIGVFHVTDYGVHTLEILLPPPESII